MPIAKLEDEFLQPFKREYVELVKIKGEVVEKMPKEELLLLYYSYYHYFNGNPDEIENVRAGIVYEKAAIAGVPFAIFRASKEDVNNIEDDAQQNTVDVLIPCWHNGNETPTAFAPKLAKMLEDVDVYIQRRTQDTSFTSLFECRLRDLGFTNYGNDNCPIRLIFLTNLKPTSKENGKGQAQTMERRVSRKILPTKILYGADIEAEILNTQSTYPYVAYGELWLDTPNNICRYQNSLIVNLKAKALQKLYKNYAYRGLLAQNLRFYVKDARVDSGIRSTIENRPDTFWYLNNGITISCSSCKIEGSRVYLENFSIVNGGQTTYLVGNAGELKRDFDIVCKIISRHPYLDDAEQEDLLADIAVASNSQKKIQAKDLVANSPEQRRLKRLFAQNTPTIFYRVKRGESVRKEANLSKWQDITHNALAQWIFSFIYQRPGPSRSSPATLFSNEVYYNQIFKSVGMDARFVCDISRLRCLINKMVPTKKQPRSFDRVQAGLFRNAELMLLAITGALYKCWMKKAHLLKCLEGCEPSECGDYLLECFGQWDVNWAFLNYPAEDKDLEKWILYCLTQYVVPAYQRYCSERNASSDYSGFTKGGKYYHEYALAIVAERLLKGFSSEEEALFKTYFREPTGEDLTNLERELNALKKA